MTRFAKFNGVVAVSFMTAFLLTFAGCHKAKDPWEDVKGGKLKVLASFPPLYCFTDAVGGKDIRLRTVSATTGPHEYEPTSADAQVVAGADLFLVSGLHLDDKVAKLANKDKNNNKIKVVAVADKALPDSKRLKMDEDADHDHDAAKGQDKDKDHAKEKGKDQEHAKGKEEPKEHEHDHGVWDPHTWLGIEQAKLMVGTIRDSLKDADSAHAADYDRRAADYVKKLDELHEYGKKKLADVKNKKFIAQHDSLQYFCKSYGLELVDAIMPQPGVEPDAKKLAELVETCKKNDIRVIAVEPQYSKKEAETLKKTLEQKGHQLEIVVIDPLETVDDVSKLNADYYLEVVRHDIDLLAKNLK